MAEVFSTSFRLSEICFGIRTEKSSQLTSSVNSWYSDSLTIQFVSRRSLKSCYKPSGPNYAKLWMPWSCKSFARNCRVCWVEKINFSLKIFLCSTQWQKLKVLNRLSGWRDRKSSSTFKTSVLKVSEKNIPRTVAREPRETGRRTVLARCLENNLSSSFHRSWVDLLMKCD